MHSTDQFCFFLWCVWSKLVVFERFFAHTAKIDFSSVSRLKRETKRFFICAYPLLSEILHLEYDFSWSLLSQAQQAVLVQGAEFLLREELYRAFPFPLRYPGAQSQTNSSSLVPRIAHFQAGALSVPRLIGILKHFQKNSHLETLHLSCSSYSLTCFSQSW